MSKSIIPAADARTLITNLLAARLDRIETSLATQIEIACAEGDTQTLWRAPLPPVLRAKLTTNGYTLSISAEGFLVSWAP